MITRREYRQGDSELIPVAEKDPHDGWHEWLEGSCSGLLSYELDGKLVAVTGFAVMWDGVAMALALIDRDAVRGNGRELAAVVKDTIQRQMKAYGLHRVQATSEPEDRASRVFLRACGYTFESTMRNGAPDKSDLLVYVILETDHEQKSVQDDQEA